MTVKGMGNLNEDALIVNERCGLYGVVDGATSLVPYRGTGGETGGFAAARLVADYMNGLAEGPGEGPEALAGTLIQANRLLREAMVRAGIDTGRHEQLWSACAVVVRIGERWIDYAQAGDCMLAAYGKDGTIRVVTHDQLAHVDDATKAVWTQGAAQGLTTRDELWAHALPQIVLGRKLANRDGGYAVLNGDPAFAGCVEFGRINRLNLGSLLLFTDGLYLPVLPGESDRDGAGEVAAKVRDMGLERYMDWLIGTEESDPDCIRFPRVKKSDDKSAIRIRLHP